MEFLKDIQGLSPSTLSAVKYCLVLSFLLHLPYVALIIGGSVTSILFNLAGAGGKNDRYRFLSKKVIEFLPLNSGEIILFGLIPLIPISLIYSSVVYGKRLLPWWFWVLLFILIAAGFIKIRFFRASFGFKTAMPLFYSVSGTVGVKLLLLAYLLFMIGTGYLASPEKWPFVQKNIWAVITWNSLVKYMELVVYSFAISGAALLLLLDRERDGRGPLDPDFANLVTVTGERVSLVFTMFLAPLAVLDLFTLHQAAISIGVYLCGALVIVLSMISALFLYHGGEYFKRRGLPAISVYILIMLVMVGAGHIERGNALSEHDQAMAAGFAQAKSSRERLAEERAAKKEKSGTEEGRAVFEKVCTGCHRFDKKLIGPPLESVLARYEGDLEGLKGFISNPVKVDPAYPAMPKLSLSEGDIDGVAKYLLSELEKM